MSVFGVTDLANFSGGIQALLDSPKPAFFGEEIDQFIADKVFEYAPVALISMAGGMIGSGVWHWFADRRHLRKALGHQMGGEEVTSWMWRAQRRIENFRTNQLSKGDNANANIEERGDLFQSLVHLQNREVMALVLYQEEKLRMWLERDWISAEVLNDLFIHLPPDPLERQEAKRILEDPLTGRGGKENAVVRYAYSYAGELTFSAVRLLIKKGLKMLAGEESRLYFVDHSTLPDFLLAPGQLLADELDALAKQYIAEEASLKHHPSMGGKIRSSAVKTPAGYFEGAWGLLEEEAKPILLWPSTPGITLETIEEMVWTGSDDPFLFRLSLSMSGSVGEDLKLGALAVYGILPYEYPFPSIARTNVGFTWLAPIVEGASGGRMGYIDVKQVVDWTRGVQGDRYDYLFLEFERPPRASYFDKAHDDEDGQRWGAAMDRFAQIAQPRVLKIDPDNRSITFAMQSDGEKVEAVYFPPTSDWLEMIRFSPLQVHLPRFQRRLFAEFARRTLHNELEGIVDAIWSLGVLAEARRKEISENRQDVALKKLADRFEKRMKEILNQASLPFLLRTPWIGNKNWEEIRAEMQFYQEILRKEPHVKEAISELVADVVQNTYQVLNRLPQT